MKKTLYLLIAAMLLGMGVAGAAPQKKKARAPRAKAAASAVTPECYTGTFANSYSDGVGGTVTHLLTIAFDSAAGTCTGTHTNDSGEARPFTGTLQGGKLVCTYSDDNEEFGTMSLLDGNTIKVEGFTGTFKRGKAADVTPAYSGSSTEAYVDPAYEQLKQHLQQQQQPEGE
ncbi:MAG: hypothetical protein IKR25_03335 [Muribaculaceae bacterium]|nr:hypothetical protein [Muribaculaceae bacterium]